MVSNSNMSSALVCLMIENLTKRTTVYQSIDKIFEVLESANLYKFAMYEDYVCSIVQPI